MNKCLLMDGMALWHNRRHGKGIGSYVVASTAGGGAQIPWRKPGESKASIFWERYGAVLLLLWGRGRLAENWFTAGVINFLLDIVMFAFLFNGELDSFTAVSAGKLHTKNFLKTPQMFSPKREVKLKMKLWIFSAFSPV